MTKKVIIFGGAGFVGSELTKTLLSSGFQVTVVCTNLVAAEKKLGEHPKLFLQKINIFDDDSLNNILKDQHVIINLIGKLFESHKNDFQNFHYIFVKKLCSCLDNNQHLIHISSLGVVKSQQVSHYAKTKFAAENHIRSHAHKYNIIKPSIIFGEHDNFFNMFFVMAKFSPLLPLISGGKTKFSPVYVKDLAKAIKIIMDGKYINETYAACGPDTSNFKELLQFILNTTQKKRILFPIPSSIAKIQAYLMNNVGIYILTPDQVNLLQFDNVNSNLKNIDTLVGKLSSYKKIVPTYLK